MAVELEERVSRVELELEQFIRETRAGAAEINISLSRLERLMETSRKENNKLWSDLAKKMGTVVEDIVAPSLERIALENLNFGEIEDFNVRRLKRHPLTKQRREFDVIVVGPKNVLLNETKSSPSSENVKEFADFVKSGEFFGYFPEHQGKKLVPVFSALFIPENVIAQLTNEGIYAVAMGNETMRVLNLEGVREKK